LGNQLMNQSVEYGSMLWRGIRLHFFVKFEQTFTAQLGFFLQHLQTRTQIDEFNRNVDFVGFGNDAGITA